jgi:hypothetical protein
VSERIAWAEDMEPQSSFLATVRQAETDHDRARRAFLVANRMSAGASWMRLRSFASSLVPPAGKHVASDGAWAFLDKYLEALPQVRVGNAALGLGTHDHEKGDVVRYRAQVLQDLETFEEELLHRIGLYWSHRALLQRFKTRCERFESEKLRALVDANSGSAENALTLIAAEYLFDAGLNPLFDAAVVKLSPDLFDATTPSALYIETKQYAASPRKELLEAPWQIWDTWHELDGQHDVREAFLLVFRRGGPLVTFDEFARHGGRTLYPILVDIAETRTKGSRASEAPIHISAVELLPKRTSPDEAKQ